MTSYSLSPLARAELAEIHAFTKRRWDERQADIYIQGMFEVFGQIAEGRALSRALTSMGVDGWRTIYNNHYIYWRELASGEVAILTILHAHMVQADRVRVAFERD